MTRRRQRGTASTIVAWTTAIASTTGAGAVWAGAPRAEQAATAVAPATVASVDQLFARWETTESPGCTVGVAQNGVTVLARAYGMADLEQERPNTTDTIIEAGSVSKQFTAAAVLLLAEQKKLSLDDPIRKYIPEVPDYPHPITIRHLLTHTSGLRDWGSVADVAGWPRWTRMHTHAHVLDLVSRQKSLNFEPGSEYSYSNTGFNLAAILVSRVSGQPFAEFTRRYIFEPLGMQSTSWRDDYARVVKGRARAYQRDRHGAGWREDMPFENAHGNGGLLTTVGDLLAWNDNFTRATVGGPDLLALMQQPHRLNDGTAIEYAAGLRVATWRGVAEVGHSGSTAGYRAHLTRFPEQGLSVAILCNAADANAGALAHSVAEIYLGGALAPAPRPRTIVIEPARLDQRAGVYRSQRTGAALRLMVRDGDLWDAGGARLAALSPTEFLLGEGGTRVEFEQDASGTITGLRRLPVNRDERERFDRLPAVSPTAEALAAYTGRYTSDEAEVDLVASIEDGGLVLRRRPDTRVPLTPAWADTFTSDLGTVTFRRGAGGRIEGLSVSASRMYDMRFTR